MAMDGDGCDGGGIWFETEVFEAPGSDELCPVLKNRMLRFGAKEAWPPWLMEQRKWTNRMSLGARPHLSAKPTRAQQVGSYLGGNHGGKW